MKKITRESLKKAEKGSSVYTMGSVYKLPDTWTPIFDLTNKNRVDKWLSDGKKQLKLVIGNIMSKRKGNFVDRKLYSRKPEL